MFFANHTNPAVLAKYFKTIEDIVIDINFKITKNGIYIKGMDPSQVSLLDCFIDCRDFSEYKYDFKVNEILIGINVKSFCKIMRASEKIDTVQLCLSNNSIDILNITFDNTSRKSEFQLKLMNIPTKEISIRDIDYQVKINMCIKRFIKLCSDMNIVDSENIEFDINNSKKEIYIKACGDIGQIKTLLKENSKKKRLKINKKNKDGTITTNSVVIPSEYTVYPFKCNLNIEFSLKSIESILKISSIVNRLQLNINEECPLKLEFMTSDNSYIHYYIAPKITDSY